MWTEAVREMTAEWECTGCATINRCLLPVGSLRGRDRCVHCRRRHEITPGPTPVRWSAQPR